MRLPGGQMPKRRPCCPTGRNGRPTEPAQVFKLFVNPEKSVKIS